jgi:hypothetical protein
MSSRSSRIVTSALFALLVAATAGLAQAGSRSLPPHANAYGSGYAELAADWLEWVLSIPAATNPLFDASGVNAAAGQSGKVWFLVGTVGGPAQRAIAVPNGKALFFPIVNYFWVNAPELGDEPWSPAQETYVRGYLAGVVDTAYGLALEVDGQTVPNVHGLRVAGAVGACMLPDDNIFGVPFEPVPHPCVADGYWVLLPPLSTGSHTIRFVGGIASQGFALDVTYQIVVGRE